MSIPAQTPPDPVPLQRTLLEEELARMGLGGQPARTSAEGPRPGLPASPQAPEKTLPADPTRMAPTCPPSAVPALAVEDLVARAGQAPRGGWRRAVFVATAGLANLGPSPAERREWDLLARIRSPIGGCHRIAFIGLGGGAGKTTAAVTLGSTLASLRGDRIVAVEAGPGWGGLGERLPRRSRVSLQDLRAFASRAPFRLDALVSAPDPAVWGPFDDAGYRSAMELLQQFYPLILTDCGPGMPYDAVRAVLGCADAVVVVDADTVAGARSAIATLDWLGANNHPRLARGATVILSAARSGRRHTATPELLGQLAARCRGVVRVPRDPHLEAGSTIDLGALRERTRLAYLWLAALLADGFTPRAASPRVNRPTYPIPA